MPDDAHAEVHLRRDDVAYAKRVTVGHECPRFPTALLAALGVGPGIRAHAENVALRTIAAAAGSNAHRDACAPVDLEDLDGEQEGGTLCQRRHVQPHAAPLVVVRGNLRA